MTVARFADTINVIAVDLHRWRVGAKPQRPQERGEYPIRQPCATLAVVQKLREHFQPSGAAFTLDGLKHF